MDLLFGLCSRHFWEHPRNTSFLKTACPLAACCFSSEEEREGWKKIKVTIIITIRNQTKHNKETQKFTSKVAHLLHESFSYCMHLYNRYAPSNCQCQVNHPITADWWVGSAFTFQSRDERIWFSLLFCLMNVIKSANFLQLWHTDFSSARWFESDIEHTC